MKAIAKGVVNLIALAVVAPAALLYALQGLLVGRARAFPGWSQAFALVPGTPGVYLRRAFYRLVLSRCEMDCCLCFGTILSHPTARIGRRVYVGPYGMIGDVDLEDDVLLGTGVSVINGGSQHGIDRLDVPVREQPGAFPRVSIGRDAWLGDRAVVLADVGAHAVIGAGSVVPKPIPEYAIAVGSPARVLRYRTGAPVEGATTQAGGE